MGLIRSLAAEGATVLLSSHYMDEVEALAQKVAVMARGRIVATGPPASLGGRDHGRVTIRFVLPDDVRPVELPVVPSGLDGRTVEIVTDDEVKILAGILNWALDGGVEIRGLSVTRTPLEDIYLDLTRSNADEANGVDQ